MHPNSCPRRPAVQCFLTVAGEKYVVIPLSEVETQKQGLPTAERDLYADGELVPLQAGMLQWVSGGQKKDEASEAAMLRELREELGLDIPSDQLTELGAAVSHTVQQRAGQVVVLEGKPYIVTLSDQQLSVVAQELALSQRRLEVLSLAEMLNGHRALLRPFAQGAIELLTGNYPTQQS